MKWEVEVLSPSSPYVHHNNTTHWFLGDNNIINNNNRSSTKWTHEENKLFENALALHDKDTPDRWHRVAEMIPGKTVLDVMKQYHELLADVSDIENGLVPIPGYSTSTTTTTSPFTLDWVNNTCSGYDGFKGIGAAAKRSSKTPEQERKKGVPWTEEEHKLFLLGLKKYGKGDWRNISRNFVITRTPTQVASHAQKYFIRQLSGGKDKRRASIHDITTVNLTDNNRTVANPSSEDSSKRSTSPQHHHSMVFSNSNPIGKFQWNNNINNDNDDTKSNSGGGGGVSAMRFNNDDEAFMSHHYGVNSSYGFKMQGQNMHKSALNESSYLGLQTQNIAFQM